MYRVPLTGSIARLAAAQANLKTKINQFNNLKFNLKSIAGTLCVILPTEIYCTVEAMILLF